MTARRATAAGVAVLAVAVVTAILVVRAPGTASAPPPRGADAALGLPAPTTGGLRVARTAPIGDRAGRSSWIAVRSDTRARVKPTAHAHAVGTVAARTPENTTNIVQPLARHRDAAGRLWLRVRLAALPNGRAGWVPRDALGSYGSVDTRLLVDRRALTATLLRAGRRVLRVPVAIGTAAAPTPAGTFLIRNVLRRYRSAFYGPIAFGTSARSATLTDWPGGGYIGIHGTNRPALVPGRVSHGCIRLRNADLRRLARLMPVGTPLTIV